MGAGEGEVSVHGDDVMGAIREVLLQHNCPRMSEIRAEAKTEGGLRRDGTLYMEGISYEWWRAFRITVEVIDPREVTFDAQTGEWLEGDADG